MKIPRVVIAGVSSSVGKTSITIGIMQKLIKEGYRVQGFKVGPDYIDPSYHTSITKRQSRNLDLWLMGKESMIESFARASSDADISIIEGVMGLFDGVSGSNNFGSTAHIAKLLAAPVILVLDAGKTARSIAAIALGFMKFDKELKIAGIILNNVAGEKHAKYCIDALKTLKIPIVGIVKRNKEITLEERHLGLIPTNELRYSKKVTDVASYISEQLDIDAIVKIAFSSPLLNVKIKGKENKRRDIRIAVALDESFNFYYADNLDILHSLGAELVFFSPISDRSLPDADGVYIGGGFPEVLAKPLAENTSMLNSIRKAAYDRMPIYAECGGLMYLSRSIVDFDGKRYNMVNLFDIDAVMERRLTLNYTKAEVVTPCMISNDNKVLKGHEFHYSRMENVANDMKFAYELNRGKGIDGKRDGIMMYNTLASYMHLYFKQSLARRFLENCRLYARR